MKDFTIITDSCCDLPSQMAEKLGIRVMPLTVIINGTEYANYLDEREITFKDFYKKMREEAESSTSAMNGESLKTAIEEEVAGNKDVLVLSFSSALSNTYNVAAQTVQEMSKKYPDSKIYAVDTLAASMGQGLLVYLACKQKEKGKSIDEVKAYVEDNKLNLAHWFTVDDLHFLKRGGRISKATAILGTMLSIKPVLHVDNEGRLISMFKTRGRSAALNKIAEEMENTVTEPEKQTIFISHGDCMDDVNKLIDIIKSKIKVKDIVVNYVGPVIGSHSGPGTVALFFMGNKR